MNRDQVETLIVPHEKIYWGKYDLTVIGTGYTEDGVRCHLVEEDLKDTISFLSNAWVIGGGKADGYGY